MKRVVAFDFDGTYTVTDSLPLFLKHAFGTSRYWLGVLVCLPWIVLWKLHIISAHRAKEHLMGHFVKGMPQSDFQLACERFYVARKSIVRPEAETAMRRACEAGDTVLVVTASAGDWVRQWFPDPRVTVVATEMEVDHNGCLTGRFATPNCNGEEKWRRIQAALPDIENCHFTAYGDSHGDRAMLSHAQKAYYRNFTTPQDELPWWRRVPGRLFWSVMALLVLWQLLGVFFGLDVADAGFYLTFYDNIFSHPESVEYNFMYYLNGVIGGFFQAVFPSMGIVGMRLFGVMFNTLAGVVVYYGLRHDVDERAIALGCALVVVAFVSPPLTLSYDLCTVLFYACAIVLLWKGMKLQSLTLIMLAGALAGLNVLVRMPNVLGLSMALLPLIVSVFTSRNDKVKMPWKTALGECVLFLCGAVMAVVVVLLLMPASHYVALKNVMRDLHDIASDTSGTASHSMSQMLLTQGKFYLVELYTGVKLAVPILAYWAVHHRVTQRWARYGIKLACLAVVAWFVFRMHPLQPLWLLSVTGCIWLMVKDKGGWLTWMALLGLGMLLVMPMGSDGAYNNGSIIAWVAAPVACVLWRARSRWPIVAVFLLSCAVHNVTDGVYFDGGPLYRKSSTVNHPRAAMVFTTPQRAQVINRLLNGIEPYVKPETTLFAYGSIPTINYLTHTHPYLGCSWPEQLSAAMMEKKLAKAATVELPLILRQKFNTLGMEWGKPSVNYLTDYGEQNTYQDNRKLQVLNAFMERYCYQPIYEDDYFVLYESHTAQTEAQPDSLTIEEKTRELIMSTPTKTPH